jgi:Zn-dependent protease with chaperone function
MQKNILILIIGAAVIAALCYMTYMRLSTHGEQIAPLATELCATKLMQSATNLNEIEVQTELVQTLAEKEVSLWNDIAEKTGVTKAMCDKLAGEYQKQFARENRTEIKKTASEKHLSPELVQKVKAIVNDCGITAELHIVAGKMKVSPAAADTNLLYVSEPVFTKLSDAEQRFVIAHELGHIVNRDTAHQSALEALIQEECENRASFITAINRLREERADLFAINQGPQYRQGAIEFAQKSHKKYGTETADTHPKYIQRLSAAQTVDTLYRSLTAV